MKQNAPRIYSGLYVPVTSEGDHAWVGRAIARHLRWCGARGVEYSFVASTLERWSAPAAYPWSWSFGTLVKFEAMRLFLMSPENGDTFIWMDLDIYPEDNASIKDLTSLGQNLLAAPSVSPAFCGYPMPGPAHLNTYCKLLWTGLGNKSEYYALCTSLFSLSRPLVESFWEWLGPMDTPGWWSCHHSRQIRCAELGRGAGAVEPFCFGTHEAIMEDWLNETKPEFTQLDFVLHGLCDSGEKHKFTHYYGSHKDSYPSK